MLRGRTPLKDKGFQKDDFRCRQRLTQFFQKHSINSAVLFNANAVTIDQFMPDIIDSDQNRQNVRLYVDNVHLHACVDVNNSITAHAAVKALVLVRMLQGNAAARKKRISVAKAIPVCSITSRIRY